MRKILSIDFDYIMYPCIKLYNDYCVADENPTVLWDNMERRLELEKFLCCDAKALENIFLLIQRNVNNKAKFIPIENHDEIVNLLNLQDDEKIDLVNVDFHHDIWYTYDPADLNDFDEFNVSNWVGYLYLKNHLSSYTWVKAPNSDLFNDPKVEYTVLPSNCIDDISDDFDEVYFCLSPHWVPYKYKHLYDLAVKLFSGGK